MNSHLCMFLVQVVANFSMMDQRTCLCKCFLFWCNLSYYDSWKPLRWFWRSREDRRNCWELIVACLLVSLPPHLIAIIAKDQVTFWYRLTTPRIRSSCDFILEVQERDASVVLSGSCSWVMVCQERMISKRKIHLEDDDLGQHRATIWKLATSKSLCRSAHRYCKSHSPKVRCSI